MNLPHSFKLPIDKLAAVFKSTSATYKYYWLIALIELVEEKKEEGLLNVNAQRLGWASVQGYYPWSCTGAYIA